MNSPFRLQGSQALVIRADSSIVMGAGHVMRCLALAQAWQDVGGRVVFATGDLSSAIEQRLRSEQVEVVKFNGLRGAAQDASQLEELGRAHHADWVVVDGYQFDADYQRKVKDAGLKLLFIDDDGHAQHYLADLVLNQNAHACESLYQSRAPQTKLLLGPRFALLRREFEGWRHWKRETVPLARRVLVTMGGSDPDNVTAIVIHALQLASIKGLEAIIVIGASNPHVESLERAASQSQANVSVLKDVTNMAEHMAWADVAISGAGSTCWEMCLLGLPALLIDLAENQRAVAKELDRRGAAIHLGGTDNAFPEKIADKLRWLLDSNEIRTALSMQARELVDGKGAERVISAMRDEMLRLRRVEEKDCRLLWEWANDPQVRNASFSQAPIPWDQHQSWFAGMLRNDGCLSLIAEDENGRGVGQLRVDRRSGQECDIDVSLSRDFRGAGQGSRFIDLGVRNVFESTGMERVHAFIRPENRASIRAFERANFVKLGEEVVKGHAAIHYVRSRDKKGKG
jgi:UDP-2,4-diacetamido-2,4,6-trideoxy-beta-L-altropyranose hydrolase